MFTPTLHLFLKSKITRTILITIIVSWMGVYPIYNNYYKGLAVEQYDRFLDFKDGKSMFFNPWQYRILCPLMIEGIYQVLNRTVYQLVTFESKKIILQGNTEEKKDVVQKMLQLSQEPEFIKYTIVFVSFRFIQHLLILWLAYQYFSVFINNKSLKVLGLMLIPLFMGNAVMDSDLAFNSYMDVILYLWAGLVIVKNHNGWWIVLITTIGALNRETSLLIPLLYFASKAPWSIWKQPINFFLKDKSSLIISCVSTLLFLLIFISIRNYYGYQPPTEWRVPAGIQMIKLNLFSAASIKTYNEMFGVFAFLPIWCLIVFRQLDSRLKIFFLSLVPLWFATHLISVVAYQSRLFLVPTLLIFLPAIIKFIENKVIEDYHQLN